MTALSLFIVAGVGIEPRRQYIPSSTRSTLTNAASQTTASTTLGLALCGPPARIRLAGHGRPAIHGGIQLVPGIRWVAILWPGLPHLWWRGAWSGLALACGFAVLLDIAILSTWVWTELLDLPFRLFAWCGVLLFWLGSAVAGALQMPALLRVPSTGLLEDLFARAQGEYLKGNWFECEVVINRLLEEKPDEVDARLLLASLLRRLGHGEEARQQLRELATLEGAGKWQLEVAREWQLLCDSSAVSAHPTTVLPASPPHTYAAQNVHQVRADTAALPEAA